MRSLLLLLPTLAIILQLLHPASADKMKVRKRYIKYTVPKTRCISEKIREEVP
jgi:hypothetical protein